MANPFVDSVDTLTFDIFGTVLDLTGSLVPPIRAFLEGRDTDVDADALWAAWRARQRVEQYQDALLMVGHSGYLESCRRAFVYCLRDAGVPYTDAEVAEFMRCYQDLAPFDDAVRGLHRLRDSGRYRLVALSNGEPDFLEHLASNRIEFDFDAIISVQEGGAFKPHPGVYRAAARILESEPEPHHDGRRPLVRHHGRARERLPRRVRQPLRPAFRGDALPARPRGGRLHRARRPPSGRLGPGRSDVAVHQGLTVADAGELDALLRKGTVFERCNFDDAELWELDVPELELRDCSLRRVDFRDLVCERLVLSGCDLEGARFDGADAHEAVFENCNCQGASFRGAKLNLAKLLDSDFSACRFEGANLFGADLTGSRLRAVDLSDTNLDGVTVHRTDLSMASLRFKRIGGGRLAGVNLTEADLTGCDLSGTRFEDCHLASVYVSAETRFDRCDLRGAHVSNAALATASMRGAIVSAARPRAPLRKLP